MAFRRALRNGGTSTARSALASSTRATRSTRASQAAMLHGRSPAPSSGPRLAVAATPQAARAPAASRGMASAMPAEDRDSAESASTKTTRFFQPVEKLANGVAVIRCVCVCVCVCVQQGRAPSFCRLGCRGVDGRAEMRREFDVFPQNVELALCCFVREGGQVVAVCAFLGASAPLTPHDHTQRLRSPLLPPPKPLFPFTL